MTSSARCVRVFRIKPSVRCEDPAGDTGAESMASQANSALPDGSVIGGYRILRKISSGGFSIVYLARDEHERLFAIKEYLPARLVSRAPGERSPTVAPEHLSVYRHGLKAFFEEGRALARIPHPNIVRVVNFFRENGTVYLVMAYERGL
ncbi:MAG: hypothetical protein RIS35_3208, partial [Pseudomonadota bacterium]